MLNLSTVTDDLDIATKEYADTKASLSHTHAAGDVTSGTFATARIPSLAASKITSGTLATARGGVPTGGSTGQVLAKKSNTNNDLEWVDQSGGGGGVASVVLYDNAAGYNGNITLTESAANYNFMRVYFFVKRDSDQTYASSDIYSPNGKVVSLFAVRCAARSSAFHYAGATYSISGTAMNLVSSAVADSAGNISGDWNTYIYRVEAWNSSAAVTGSGSGSDTSWTQSSYTNGYYMRRGKMVSVLCESWGDITAPNNSYASVFTLPEGFRPLLPSGKSLYGASSPLGGSYPITWRIDSDGKVNVGGCGTSSGYWAWSTTFPCE